jgi:Initiator Replication protein
MNNKKEVIKASAAVQVQNKMTLLQRRAWNILLAHAYDELPTEEWHHIGVHDLMQVLEFHSKNEDYLKDALEALVGCKVKWNVLDKDGTAIWGVAALLAEAEIKAGVCTYAYGPKFRSLLYNPKMYARVCLSLQNRFDSKHALALWELCIDYLGAERDYGETPFISLEHFRELMGITEGMYPTFKRLSEKVINPAITEINRLSDFRVTVDYQRQSRKIVALKFKIRRVVLLPEPNKGQGRLFPELDDMPVVVRDLQEAGISAHESWEIWQQGFSCVHEGVRPAVPAEGADRAFEYYIREKIHLLQRKLASGRVENITGFLLEAIRKNFANPEFAQERTREAAAEALKANKKRNVQMKRLEAQKAEIEQAREKALSDTYDELVRTLPEVLEAALTDIFAGNAFLRQYYDPDKSALANYQVSMMFKEACRPYLERHTPERIQAIRTRYATEIAALEEQIAALQAV